MRFFLALLLCLPWLPCAAWAGISPSSLCRSAIASAERSFGVPDRLMQAIGVVESGRPDELGGVTAWPWTINVEGVGYVFDTKQEAIAAVNAHREKGARSIDVGCMQVNLLHHGSAFASLDQAFDPVANARYAAEFLQKLLAQTGSWPRAAAGYHSMTPDIGADYGRKVLGVWARPGLGEPAPYTVVPRGANIANIVPPATAFTSTAPSRPLPATSGGLSMASSMTARVLPIGTGAAPVPATGPGPGSSVGQPGSGRTLAAYRAMPTRLATVLPFRRG